MLYISNTFSGTMLTQNVLPNKGIVDTAIIRYNIEAVRRRLDRLERDEYTSVVDNVDLASVLTTLLGRTIEVNKVSPNLKLGDEIIWAQYSGPRIPKWATRLPKGGEIVFLGIRL